MSKKGRAAVAQATNDRHADSGYTDKAIYNLTKGDGTGTLLVNGTADRRIWLHRRDENGRIRDQVIAWYPVNLMLTPLRDGDTRLENYKVRIGKPPGVDEFFVIDANTREGMDASGGMTPFEELINQGYWATPAQMTMFRMRPTDTPSTSIIMDIGLTIVQPSTNTFRYQSSVTIPLAAYISALTGGQHQFILPYYDSNLLTYGVLTQAAVTATNSVGTIAAHNEFTSATMPNFTGLSSNFEYGQPLELYYGQTTITESAFYRDLDARQFAGGGSMALDDLNKMGTDANGQFIVDANGNVGLMQ